MPNKWTSNPQKQFLKSHLKPKAFHQYPTNPKSLPARDNFSCRVKTRARGYFYFRFPAVAFDVHVPFRSSASPFLAANTFRADAGLHHNKFNHKTSPAALTCISWYVRVGDLGAFSGSRNLLVFFWPFFLYVIFFRFLQFSLFYFVFFPFLFYFLFFLFFVLFNFLIFYSLIVHFHVSFFYFVCIKLYQISRERLVSS